MSSTAHQPMSVLNWLRYDESLAGKSGIYLFVIASGFAPFYAGVARRCTRTGKVAPRPFGNRLDQHKQCFQCTGLHTFFRPTLMENPEACPANIIRRWKDVRDRPDELHKFVYIPDKKGTKDETILSEGRTFWDGLITLVCPIDDASWDGLAELVRPINGLRPQEEIFERHIQELESAEFSATFRRPIACARSLRATAP